VRITPTLLSGYHALSLSFPPTPEISSSSASSGQFRVCFQCVLLLLTLLLLFPLLCCCYYHHHCCHYLLSLLSLLSMLSMLSLLSMLYGGCR
jgi:hypothetical protein